MPILVMKFGGTSVATLDRIARASKRVAREVANGYDVIVIVSAMSGKTNELVGWVEDTSPLYDAREYDAVVSSGENVTAGLMALRLQEMDIPARSWQGWQVPVQTTGVHSAARIEAIPPDNILSKFAEGMQVAVVAGFQGIAPDGRITTLGRGGSDTTAVALAAALKADECQIYTDVDGVYTTDPRVVSEARRLSRITFEEMLEMASMGSKVLQIRSVEFAGKYNVPLRVLHSFKDGPGTLITMEDDSEMEMPTIAGIAFNRDEAKLTIEGVPDMPGMAYSILGPIGEANIEVDVIVQNISHDKTADFTFTVGRNDLERAEEVLNQVAKDINAEKVTSDSKIAKVSVVGVGMRSHAGVASQMFAALAEVGINILMITTSEIKISVIIEEKFLELAVRALHSSFGLEKEPNDEGAA